MPTSESIGIPQPAPGQLWSVLEDGRWAFWFDAHTVSDFTKCETYFDWKNLRFAPQQLRPKGPMRACMTIGSWWSRVSELFYKRVAGWQASCNVIDEVYRDQKPTMMDILTIAAHAWVDSNMDALELADPAKYEKFAIPVRYGEFGKFFPNGGAVEDMFLSQYRTKINKLRESEQREEARRLEARTALPLGALLMAAQYYDTFAEQDMRNWTVIAAEEPFGRHGDVCVGENDKVVVFWQGKPDLVVYEAATGVLAPIDQKTKDYIPYDVEKIWKPNSQMAGYIYALGVIANDLGYSNAIVDRCVLSVCGRLKPATPQKKGANPKPRFARVRPTWSQDELNEWRIGILNKAKRMRHIIETGEITRNEFQCHIYAGCEYRRLCSQPAGVRPIVIGADFNKQDPWTPFEDED
jgi:hypothetical protein